MADLSCPGRSGDGSSELLRIDDGTCPQAAVAIDAKRLSTTSSISSSSKSGRSTISSKVMPLRE
jgi:hypothetical protein